MGWIRLEMGARESYMGCIRKPNAPPRKVHTRRECAVDRQLFPLRETLSAIDRLLTRSRFKTECPHSSLALRASEGQYSKPLDHVPHLRGGILPGFEMFSTRLYRQHSGEEEELGEGRSREHYSIMPNHQFESDGSFTVHTLSQKSHLSAQPRRRFVAASADAVPH